MNGAAPMTSIYDGHQCVVGRARYEALECQLVP